MLFSRLQNRTSCRWVEPRLPLFAGDDLSTIERRRVERHLIGCPACRARREALDSSLRVLRTSATQPLVSVGDPSIWPALERQIRGSRHESRGLSFWFENPLGLAAAALGLAGCVTGFLFLQRGSDPAPVDLATQVQPPPRPALPVGKPSAQPIVAKSSLPASVPHLDSSDHAERDPQRSY